MGAQGGWRKGGKRWLDEKRGVCSGSLECTSQGVCVSLFSRSCCACRLCNRLFLWSCSTPAQHWVEFWGNFVDHHAPPSNCLRCKWFNGDVGLSRFWLISSRDQFISLDFFWRIVQNKSEIQFSDDIKKKHRLITPIMYSNSQKTPSLNFSQN